MSVATAFCVGVDVQLDLSYPCIELSGKRRMRVVETLVGVGILREPDFSFAGCDSSVITVVRADDPDLIQLDRIRQISLAGCKRRTKRQGAARRR
jgi:hypothetical protein